MIIIFKKGKVYEIHANTRQTLQNLIENMFLKNNLKSLDATRRLPVSGPVDKITRRMKS